MIPETNVTGGTAKASEGSRQRCTIEVFHHKPSCLVYGSELYNDMNIKGTGDGANEGRA